MSRKTPSFLQLIDYISREGHAVGHPVTRNLSADPANSLKTNRAFFQNARHCPHRKNGVFLYHEILSLSPEDRSVATPEILADLAERYLALRAPEAMAWGRVHFDKNPHVHLIISANLKNRQKKLRLSKKDFAQVKRELEAYQKERYPQLARSVVFESGEKRKERGSETGNEQRTAREVKEKTDAGMRLRTHPEQARAKRLQGQGKGRGDKSTKETVRQHVLDALTASLTMWAFEERLQHNDISLYERGGRPAGIVAGNKKYRYKTLGLEEAFRSAATRWERLPQRKGLLRGIFAEKARCFVREFGFADQIMEVLGHGKEYRDRQYKGSPRQRRFPDGIEPER